ncbi:hypothetical protein POVCU2_0051660 [Plasmodium ovale curtisi]|uniref:Uncharacterized protein n=1 Tax=Plasmodium ovale curtisi TaxID=864141 RepID=A0A1A8X0B2_PLAOA|nr:hypothetical protein POVCU2_0051660 [Plasmodium ovale curtisi]SBS98675.1 hypothetical protein POVCU1_047930 [Plasmodium ovale curtisi]
MFDSSVVQTAITQIFEGQQPHGKHTRLQKQAMQKGRHPSSRLFREDDSINISTPVTAAIPAPYSSTFSPLTEEYHLYVIIYPGSNLHI